MTAIRKRSPIAIALLMIIACFGLYDYVALGQNAKPVGGNSESEPDVVKPAKVVGASATVNDPGVESALNTVDLHPEPFEDDDLFENPFDTSKKAKNPFSRYFDDDEYFRSQVELTEAINISWSHKYSTTGAPGLGIPPSPIQTRRSVATVTNEYTVLPAEQKHALLIALRNKLLREQTEKIMTEDDAEGRKALLSELKDIYRSRFQIDTAYQDYRVRKIEARTKKLRDEITAREDAREEWVDAMVTLAKMRANGIDTIDPNVLPVAVDEPSAFPSANYRDSQTAENSARLYRLPQSGPLPQPNMQLPTIPARPVARDSGALRKVE